MIVGDGEMIQPVPKKLLEAIQRENLSRDQVIYYDEQYGWVCQQRNDAFNSFVSTTNTDNTRIAPDDIIARPLTSLGPFGKFRFIDRSTKRRHRIE